MLDPGSYGHRPGKAEDDEVIERHLLSPRQREFELGFEQLDAKYRIRIAGSIRKAWPTGVSDAELAEIWAETLLAVFENIRAKRFKPNGRLGGYLRQIAGYKAIDTSRGRREFSNALWEDGEDGAEHRSWQLNDSMKSELEQYFESLSDKLQIVIRVDIEQWVLKNGKWATLEELTREINRQYGFDLPTSTVKSRRTRAKERLRDFLIRRGYRE